VQALKRELADAAAVADAKLSSAVAEHKQYVIGCVCVCVCACAPLRTMPNICNINVRAV
jgi:hypothetical protein